ncbi:hypothetical protein NFJ02_08g137140 [Pycnococcus provasolii]
MPAPPSPADANSCVVVSTLNAQQVSERKLMEAQELGDVIDVEGTRRHFDTPMAKHTRKMLETGALADMTVTLQRKTWKLHRMQLAVGCTFFADRLNANGASASASADRVELDKDCVPGGKSAFDACVKHMYMHEAVEKTIKVDELPALAAAASVLGVDEGALEAQVLSELKERLKSASWKDTALVLAAALETRVRELAPACASVASDRIVSLVMDGSSASEKVDGVDLPSVLVQMGDVAHELLDKPKWENKPSCRSWWALTILTYSSSDKLVAWATSGRLEAISKMICVKDAKASLWECITRVLDCASDDAKQVAFHNKKGKKRKLDDYKWDGALQSLIDLGAESIMLKCEPSADSIPVEAVLAMERRARAKSDSRLSEVETRLATSQGEVSKLKDDLSGVETRLATSQGEVRKLKGELSSQKRGKTLAETKLGRAESKVNRLTTITVNALTKDASTGLPMYWTMQCESGLPWEFCVEEEDDHVALYVKPLINWSDFEEAAVKARVTLSSPMACRGTSEHTFTHEWKTDNYEGYGPSKFFPKNVLSDPRCATTFFRATVEVLLD